MLAIINAESILFDAIQDNDSDFKTTFEPVLKELQACITHKTTLMSRASADYVNAC